MRTTFFAAAMLALLGQAAYLESVDFDLADYDTELAEVEDDMDLAQIMDYDFEGEDLAEVESASEDDDDIPSPISVTIHRSDWMASDLTGRFPVNLVKVHSTS